MSEQWRDVPGWEGHYRVSDQGRVLSVAREVRNRWDTLRPVAERFLSVRTTSGGYLQVTLRNHGRAWTARVHRLVLFAFVGPCPDGFVGCHNDGNPANNELGNLRWDTVSSNALDTLKHGTNFAASKTHCKRGHPFDEANTYRAPNTPRPRRTCRKCWAMTNREYELRVLALKKATS